MSVHYLQWKIRNLVRLLVDISHQQQEQPVEKAPIWLLGYSEIGCGLSGSFGSFTRCPSVSFRGQYLCALCHSKYEQSFCPHFFKLHSCQAGPNFNSSSGRTKSQKYFHFLLKKHRTTKNTIYRKNNLQPSRKMRLHV